MGVKDDATPRSPIGSVSFGILLDVRPDGDHVVDVNVENVEGKIIDLIAARRTKKNP